MPDGLDSLDERLLALLDADPHVGVLGASRALGVARGTIQSRLDRMAQRGVISSFAPTVSPEALGYPVKAFCTLSIRQRRGHAKVIEHLANIPQVLSVHTITGDGDLMATVVARDNADLQRVIDQLVAEDLVTRTSTVIALTEVLPHRTLPLVTAGLPDRGRRHTDSPTG